MPITIAVCQPPAIMEDLEQTLYWIRKLLKEAVQKGAELVVFPECYLQGYITDPAKAKQHALDLESNLFATITAQLAEYSPMIILGLIEEQCGLLFNTAIIIKDGMLIGHYHKTHLLEGEQLFTAGKEYPVFSVGEFNFGILICYDTQFPEAAKQLADKGATVIICPSNTMMSEKKAIKFKELHVPMRAERAKENKVWLLSSDVTGHQQDRIAFGSTSVINPEGNIIAQIPFLETGVLLQEIP
ncbi:MAG: carbon-nitrogen hydrolase family protein [Chitinophagaceae bacterium]